MSVPLSVEVELTVVHRDQLGERTLAIVSQNTEGHGPGDCTILHILRVGRVHDGTDVHREARRNLAIEPVSPSSKVRLMSVPEDDVLLGAVTPKELQVPSLGLSTVAAGFVTMHSICVGCHPDWTLDVRNSKGVQVKEVFHGQCIQCGQWGSVFAYKVSDSKIVITFEPGD